MATPRLVFGNLSLCGDVSNLSAISDPPSPQNSSFNPQTCAFDSRPIKDFNTILHFLTIGFYLFNMIAHLISAIIFLELIRGRDLAQHNHHLLFILSIFEMIHAFFSELRPILTHAGVLFSHMHSFESVAALKVSYYLAMIVNSLTTLSFFCRNWWLVVIALTRSITVFRLQRILKQAEGVNIGSSILKRVNLTAFCVVLAGVFSSFLIHGLLVPMRLAFYLCHTPSEKQLYIRRIQVVESKNRKLANAVRILVSITNEVLVLMLPIIIMTAATAVIWVILRRLSGGPCTVPNQRVQMMGRVTRLIAILLTVFLVLEPLAPIAFLIQYFTRQTHSCLGFAFDNFILPLADLLVALDSTANLVVYYLWDKAFRHHLRRHLLRRCPECAHDGYRSRYWYQLRKFRRDTNPTTNQTPTVPTTVTVANVTVASAAMKEGQEQHSSPLLETIPSDSSLHDVDANHEIEEEEII